jgi:hypothetical protein
MTLGCPFCGATLATGRRWQSYGGETGGIFTSQQYECADCGAVIEHETISKAFALRERWRLAAAPPAGKVRQCVHPMFPVYQCVRCATGNLLPAVPVSASAVQPEPNRPAERTERWREISYLCHGCSARYLRHEHGGDAALAVSGWSWLVDGGPTRYEPMTDAPRQRPNAAP